MSTFILLDNARDKDGVSYLFETPETVVVAHEPGEVPSALAALEAAQARGFYAVGFLSYELGYVLEPHLAAKLPLQRNMPLLWFGLFRQGKTLTASATSQWLQDRIKGEYTFSTPRPAWDEGVYTRRFQRVHDYIVAGDIYQANLTFKARMQVKGDMAALYAALRESQPVSYGAYLDTPEFKVLSFSPELCVRKQGDTILTRPMKGTAARAPQLQDDQNNAVRLAQDEKSQAENLMIVDLMRNDFGRMAVLGSVKVPKLFEIETYPSLHQMTSTVTARLKPGTGLQAFLQALFPAGSVTGAPKIRAQEIIAELEDAARGVYTGCIGMLAPSGDAVFNVAIRTLAIDGAGQVEMGLGSGVVFDSRASEEYRECLLKMRFLTHPQPPFQLIETLGWCAKEGFSFFEAHGQRLEMSARYFAFAFERHEMEKALSQWEKAETRHGQHRVRLLLEKNGHMNITSSPLPEAVRAWRFVLSDRQVDSADPFLYHKTTQRRFWDSERENAKARYGADEVVFLNERGALTQGSITNLFLLMPGGRMLTPVLGSGLLPGILRAGMLAEGKAEEAVLTPYDLLSAEAIYLGNSVRGLIPAEYMEKSREDAA